MVLMGNTDDPNEPQATERFQVGLGQQRTSAAEPDTVGAFADDGVDLTLIHWMLRRSPTERLMAAQDLIDAAWALRDSSET